MRRASSTCRSSCSRQRWAAVHTPTVHTPTWLQELVVAASVGGGGDGSGDQHSHASAALPGATVCMLPDEFFRRWHPDLAATSTRNGFNPLLEDFTNTQFLLTGMR